MQIEISVIVPIYNSEDTIAACIDSIVAQTFSQFELILVDDGSTDCSGEVCERYSAIDNRIKVVRQTNKGRTVARYAGLQCAVGRWVAFVDSDDTLPGDALARLYEQAAPDVDIVLGNGYTLSGEERRQIPMSDFRHKAVRGDGTIGVPWGSLYRRSAIPCDAFDLPREIMNGEDYIFWLKMVFATERPVNIVYESVYNKGDEHTCNTFVWTAEYCYKLNEYRKAAIPEDLRSHYLPDMIADRLVNLFAVINDAPDMQWKSSRYFKELMSDVKACGYVLPLRSRILLSLPCRWMQQACLNFMALINRMR